jgi:hypothetical protein
VIKIPWFNIFSKSTTIEIEGVHLLIVPSTSVRYDEAKERLLELEAKQKRLQVVIPTFYIYTTRVFCVSSLLSDRFKAPWIALGALKNL